MTAAGGIAAYLLAGVVCWLVMLRRVKHDGERDKLVFLLGAACTVWPLITVGFLGGQAGKQIERFARWYSAPAQPTSEIDTRVRVLDHYRIEGGEPRPVYKMVEPEELP